jgi:hypothetical protein
LHDEQWASQIVVGGGSQTYYVRVVPICGDISDADGDVLMGTPTAENATKARGFSFQPYPDTGYCTGYYVYAGTVSGTLYYQGELAGRFNTTFVMDETWTYSSSGTTLSAQTIGPPSFASVCEIYQSQGASDARCFLGGGKKYLEGYAKVATSTVAPLLTGGKQATSTVATWQAVSAGSFRMRQRWIESSNLLDSYIDYTSLNFSGISDMDGAATVLQTAIRAAQWPYLLTGSVETSLTKWLAITDGSFNIYVNGQSKDVTGCNTGSVTSLTDVATAVQTAIRASGTLLSLATCAYDSVSGKFKIVAKPSLITNQIINGTFDADTNWTKGTGWTISGGKANFSGTATATLTPTVDVAIPGGLKYRLTYTISDISGASAGLRYIQAQINPSGSESTVTSSQITANGTYTLDIELAGAASSSSIDLDIIFYANANSAFSFKLDDVTLVEIAGLTAPKQSYLAKHSSSTGTDISTMLAGREDSTNVYLQRYYKSACTDTVTWSTDHFIFTGATTGYFYQIGWAETTTYSVGTDISSMLDCKSNSPTATYRNGQTTKRSVIGYNTIWGNWCEGMTFRVQSEGTRYVVKYCINTDCLYLDEDYAGDGLLGPKTYVLQPYSTQLYPSALGNPFKYSTTDIIQLPTNDSDEITAIRRNGPLIAPIMNHHIWMCDASDIKRPVMISDHYGAPNDGACITFQSGVAICTGEEFIYLFGNQVKSLDPDSRMRALCGRISANAPNIHGQFVPGRNSDLLVWWVALDDGTRVGIAIIFEVKTGNWWLYNHKDANCSAVLRDSDDVAYLVTGQKGDTATSTPAFIMVHGDSYYDDGAQGTDKQGIIQTVGSATKTAGYLTGGYVGSTLATFTAVTAGYFSITVDGVKYDVGPVSLSGAASLSAVATLIQTAIRAQTGGSETVAYSTDHFVFTSGTTTNESIFDYLRPYYPVYNSTNLSDKTYLNGEYGFGTKTYPVEQQTLTLYTMTSGTAAALYETEDGDKGVWVYVCDTSLKNGQYALVLSNASNTITVTPSFPTQPAAGWYWFLGGIVPTLTKWFDFGASQHKNKLYEMSVTTKPASASTFNRLGIHLMQDLSTTVSLAKVQNINSAQDTVNMIKLTDKPATQHGIKIIRPNSKMDLEIEDYTLIHRPVV